MFWSGLVLADLLHMLFTKKKHPPHSSSTTTANITAVATPLPLSDVEPLSNVEQVSESAWDTAYVWPVHCIEDSLVLVILLVHDAPPELQVDSQLILARIFSLRHSSICRATQVCVCICSPLSQVV